LNERILDGDVIHVPNVNKRIQINGATNRSGFFELLDNENANELIEFAGDFTPKAGSKFIYKSIIPIDQRDNDDSAMSSQLINKNDLFNLKLNDGDSLFILGIQKNKTDVQVLGRVKRSGPYPSSASLKEVLDAAGGFNDAMYRPSIVDDKIIILRKDKSSYYNKEIVVKYENSNEINLFPEDKILVYEDKNFTNSFTLRVSGQVNNEGIVPFKDGMTVRGAIEAAGGFTELADKQAIILKDIFTDNNNNPAGQVSNISLDTELSVNSNIEILPKKDLVLINGNVYNPGIIQFSGRDNVRSYIELAGGFKPESSKKRIYIRKNNGEIKKVKFFRGRFLSVDSGDTIFVPVKNKDSDFNVTAFTSDIISILTNLVAIAALVSNTAD